MSAAIKGGILAAYQDDRDGQIAVGTVNFPSTGYWKSDNYYEVLLQGKFAGGTTTIFIDFSEDGTNIAMSTADLFASVTGAGGTKQNIGFRYFKLRVVQATAISTDANLSCKISQQ